MANSNQGVELYICSTPQPADLDRAGFEALTWIKIGQVGNFGETGITTNMLTYPTLDTSVSQKAKGVSNAGDPPIEVARSHSDVGQIALRAAADTNYNYAFKLIRNDAPDETYTNTTEYNRGLVSGPTAPNGGVEDFDLERFILGLQQRRVVVPPELIGS